MIKFFRQIRQQLLMENKTSKYFKYAVGEIILVVIGILIALQINNWNEQRKEKLKSKEYLERIIEDLDLKINSFEIQAKRGDQMKKYLNASVKILKSGILSKQQKDTLEYTIKNYYQFVRHDGTLSTYEEMKSSGDIRLIYNKELRKEVNDYIRDLSALSKIFDQLGKKVNNNDFIDNHITQNIEDKLSESTIDYNFSKLSKDQFVINKLSRFALHWYTKKTFSDLIVKKSKDLKEKIQKELNNK